MSEGPILDPQSAFRINMEQCIDRAERFNREIISSPVPLAQGCRDQATRECRIGLVQRPLPEGRTLDWATSFYIERLGEVV